MGTLVICSYKPRAGHEDEARLLMQGHVPLLRSHDLITDREVVQGVAADGSASMPRGDSNHCQSWAREISAVAASCCSIAAAMAVAISWISWMVREIEPMAATALPVATWMPLTRDAMSPVARAV